MDHSSFQPFFSQKWGGRPVLCLAFPWEEEGTATTLCLLRGKKAAFSLLSLWILHWLELTEQPSSLSREVGRGLAALLGLL